MVEVTKSTSALTFRADGDTRVWKAGAVEVTHSIEGEIMEMTICHWESVGWFTYMLQWLINGYTEQKLGVTIGEQ